MERSGKASGNEASGTSRQDRLRSCVSALTAAGGGERVLAFVRGEGIINRDVTFSRNQTISSQRQGFRIQIGDHVPSCACGGDAI